jgi:hypothetical protein
MTISQHDMRLLLRRDEAHALMRDHFPIPVRIDDTWWHVPTAAPVDGDFEPAPPAAAAEFDRLAAKLAAAHAAVEDDAEPPR